MRLPDRAETLVELVANAVDSAAGDLVSTSVGARFVDRREEAEEFSFEEIWSRATSAAGALVASGVARGDRVVIVSPTEIGFYDAFFGALMAGAIPAPVYPPVRLGKVEEWAERTANLVESVGATVVIGDRRSRRLLGQVVGQLGDPLNVLKLEELCDHAPIDTVEHGEPDDVALIQFSSGTTRQPAPVTLTNRQILANIESIVASLPDEALRGGGCVSWLPLYHDMGLIGCLLTTMRCGQPMTLIPPEVFLMRPAIWLRVLSRYGATVSPAPNFAYARTTAKTSADVLEGVDLSKWVVAMNGAEPISVAAMRAFVEKFGKFGLRAEALTPVYGLAEAALAVTFSDSETEFVAQEFDREELAQGRAELTSDGLELPSLGRPLPGYAIEIRDANGGVLPSDRVGRLWVSGPSITTTYFRGESPTHDGWLDTGDLGFVHDGELYVTGRAKDVVVVRGRNHAPYDIERACDDVRGVRTGCSVAVGQVTDAGERVHLFVESKEPWPGLPEACRDAVRSQIGIRVDEIHVVEPGTLPRTSSGKLRRADTLERHLAGHLYPPASVSPIAIASEVARSAWGYLKR